MSVLVPVWERARESERESNVVIYTQGSCVSFPSLFTNNGLIGCVQHFPDIPVVLYSAGVYIGFNCLELGTCAAIIYQTRSY